MFDLTPKLRKFVARLRARLHISVPGRIIGVNLTFNRTNIAGNTINVAVQALNRDQLKEVIREVFEKEGALLTCSADKEIRQIGKIERARDYRRTLKRFSEVLPPTDMRILRECLYLKTAYGPGQKGRSAELKAQIVNVYGERGRRFANLCSAGYFETCFWPSLDRLRFRYTEKVARVKFLEEFNEIVEEQPWMVFICEKGSEKEFEAEILNKLAYAVHSVCVHGMGKKNVAKAHESVRRIKARDSQIETAIFEEPGRIKIDIWRKR